MKITYLGTGAAEGIPAVYCACPFCADARKRGEVRSRSQVLIDGELAIDYPPDAYLNSLKHGVELSRIRYLLVTHSHMDHFYAHDFILRGYKYAREMKSPSLSVFGNRETGEVFAECTRREMREDVAQGISFTELSALEPVSFGDYTVHPLSARHSSKEPLVYLVEKEGKRILHLTDTGALPDEDIEYLSRLPKNACSLITLDCTFLFDETASARHMGVAENAEVLARLEKIGLVGRGTKIVLTHFSHNSAPTKEILKRAEKMLGAICAYDGMTVEI